MKCECGHGSDGHHWRDNFSLGHCNFCGCQQFASVKEETAPAPSAPLLREATEAEDDLIQRLSVAVGHRLLRDWEDLPTELQVLPMNRAFLAALALSMGKFLGAIAVNDPDNVEGWRVLVEQSVEIVRQTAETSRELALAQRGPFQPGGTLPGAIKRALVPEPKLVM